MLTITDVKISQKLILKVAEDYFPPDRNSTNKTRNFGYVDSINISLRSFRNWI